MGLFNKDFIEYIILLNKYDVDYLLVGGMAVNLYGYRRSTGDMDLFINPTSENHLKLKKVHGAFGMPMGEMEDLKVFQDTTKFDVYTFGVSPIQIDVMTACKGLQFDDAFQNAVNFEVDDNVYCKVVHYRELIASKKASARLRDQADIEELERIKRNK